MRFLMRFANQGRYGPRDAKNLSSSCYEVVKAYGADIGNLRVSGTAVELDVLLSSREHLKAATNGLESKLGRLLTSRELDVPTPQMDPDLAVREGIQLFNEERYWESHESLEWAWRRAEGSEKEILQGIILTAAALVHLQKNDETVALSIMKRAEGKLAGHEGRHWGVDVPALRGTLAKMIESRRIEFFRIPS